jgi:uncharacterized protein YybS (DUF2232 family)
MLAAVAVVLVLLGNYVPVAGPFLLFTWPLPVVVIFARHGGRAGLLTTVVAWLLLTMFVGPVAAVLDSLVLGSLGLALGWAQRRRIDAAGSILAGTLAMLAALFASLGLSRLFLHENALQQGERAMVAALNQATALYARAGMPAQAAAQLRQTALAVEGLLPAVLPALLIFSALVYAFVAFLVARHVLRRLGQAVPDLPPFAEWQAPAWAAAGLAAGFACLALSSRGGTWREVGLNLVYLFDMIYLVTGIAFAYLLARHWHLPRWLAVACLAVVAVNPLLNQVAIWVGLADSVFRYRQMLKRRWEGGTP